MKTGHLDMASGRWIDETPEADDEAFAAEQKLHPPVGSAAARSGEPSPAAGMVQPQAPLSMIDKARMMQFVRGNAGNPDAVSAARETLLRGSMPGLPGVVPGAPPMPPGAPPLPPPPDRQIVVGDDGMARPMPGPGGPPDMRAVDVGADGMVRPAAPPQLSPADRAREILDRQRRMTTLTGIR